MSLAPIAGALTGISVALTGTGGVLAAPGRILARLGEALAPPLCVACARHAGRIEPLCSPCRGALRWLGPDPVRAGGVELWAPLAYEGPARALVTALKFRGTAGVTRTMAAQIAATAPPGTLSGAVLVPVPLHPARRRRRGYNQAELLVSALAARTGSGVSDCLERTGPDATQVGRGRAQRARAIAGAVTLRQAAPLPGKALLVDDVVTTGATLAACARALTAAGARSVRAIAYARTPGR
jgi:ComF family protein